MSLVTYSDELLAALTAAGQPLENVTTERTWNPKGKLDQLVEGELSAFIKPVSSDPVVQSRAKGFNGQFVTYTADLYFMVKLADKDTEPDSYSQLIESIFPDFLTVQLTNFINTAIEPSPFHLDDLLNESSVFASALRFTARG